MTQKSEVVRTLTPEEIEEIEGGVGPSFNPTVSINGYLIRSSGVSPRKLKKIFSNHVEFWYIQKRAYELIKEIIDFRGMVLKSNIKQINQITHDVQNLEFDTQLLWGFAKDKDKHRWTYNLYGCNCSLDTKSTKKENLGNCIWH